MPCRRSFLVGISYLAAVHTLDAQDTTRAHKLTGVAVTERADARKGYVVKRSRTATRTETPLRDVPQSVSVVTRALIADQAMQGMADVVRYVPGITMGQGEGHRDAPTIRGQSSTADFYVDGVRDDAQYLRDLYNVERVEALMGPNAMVFGRGGGGGVINRVTKEPLLTRTASIGVEGGSFGHKRTSVDLGGSLAGIAAGRLNALYERSGGFRRAMRVERSGVNPELALALGAETVARVGFEHFSDERTVDRGLPSFQGRPAPGDVTRYFGDPASSPSRAAVDEAHVSVSRGGFRNHTRYANYDKFYQNVYPNGAVNGAGTQVNLAAYNSTTGRSNLFNQTDVTIRARRHTVIIGTELGRQGTSNFRNTGYFNNTATSFTALVAQPETAPSVTFRQSATDADNRAIATVAGAYVQDQVVLGAHWLAIAGLRVDQFTVRLTDNRAALGISPLARTDRVVSPRVGLVFKPAGVVSLYAMQGESYLPGSGDQFSSLTVTSRTLEPERFVNRELGVKWDVVPDLALTLAAYRLDRSKSVATDPTDVARFVQTGAQRSTGVELGVSGNVTARWQVSTAYTAQRARIISATTAAKVGATTPLVPERTAFLWNKVQVARAVAIGLGIVHQGDSFAAIDNTVVLPSFTRGDAAIFYTITGKLRAQLNVENLTNARYYWTSHGNNNIMPGAPRTLRVSLNAGT